MQLAGRRSPRVSLRVPLRATGESVSCNAHTLVVNRHGALNLAPIHYLEDAQLEVRNLESGAQAGFRVAWNGGQELPGLHKVGIELQDYWPQFWGPEYDAVWSRDQ